MLLPVIKQEPHHISFSWNCHPERTFTLLMEMLAKKRHPVTAEGALGAAETFYWAEVEHNDRQQTESRSWSQCGHPRMVGPASKAIEAIAK